LILRCLFLLLLAPGVLWGQGDSVPPPLDSLDTGVAVRPVDSVGPAVLLFGERHAFTVRAPGGWVADRRSGLGQGLPTVFYPEEESWVGSPVVLYCQVLLRGGTVEDRNGAIASDVARIRRTNAGVVVTEGDSIPIGNGHGAAAVRIVRGRTNGNSEAIAYIEERGSVVLLILCGRTHDSFEDALPAFRVLVGSYIFVADDRENILRAVEAANDWSAKE